MLALLCFLGWAWQAELEQITRAPGQIIAGSRTQVIQASDGGVLSELLVKEGDKVEDGTPIGLVGNTGQSTGKHLHFEVLIGSYQVDPKKVIQTAQYVRQTQK